jgi:hypothetical protein
VSDDIIIHSPHRTIPGASPVAWGLYKDCYQVPVRPMRDISDENLIEHFVDCIEGVRQPMCGWRQQLHVHEILFKGLDAGRSGQAQQLTTTFSPWHALDARFLDARSRSI